MPTFIDCFCGAGGLSVGFLREGFELVYAFDNDSSCIETFRRNLGHRGFVRNVNEVSIDAIEKDLESPLPTIDVIIGGPPCQGFSVQRRGEDYDLRNNLVLEFIRLVLEIKPAFFVMENVGGLLSKRGKPYLKEIGNYCSADPFYYIHIAKLDAFDYGVPQHRKRAFIIGEMMRGEAPLFSFPESIRSNNNFPATVRDAIFDLRDKSPEDVPNHVADRLSELNLKRIRSIKQGQGRENLPQELWLECHKKNSSHRHMDVYGRMAWDEPSPTITARFDSFSRGRFGHPERDRTITLREGARLQSFDDDFVFVGTKVEIAKQIGNAVPPLLAGAIAKQLFNILYEYRDNYVLEGTGG